jgi:hypothetical protein
VAAAGSATGSSDRLECRLLLGLALALSLVRFLDLGFVPFINDEPKLQTMIDALLQQGELPSRGLRGSLGVEYGPVPQWLYLPVRLATHRVAAIAAHHQLLFLGGLWLLYLATRLSIGATPAAWAIALATSSPYLFFYSRLPWDNTFLVPEIGGLACALVWLERAERRRWIPAALVGLFCGLALGTHLMAAPVVAAAVLLLGSAWVRRPWAEAAREAAACTIGALAVSGPYLLQLRPVGMGGRPLAVTWQEGLVTLVDLLGACPRWLSAAGTGYFLDAPLLQLVPGRPGAWLLALQAWDPSLPLKVVVWIALPWATLRLLRGRRDPVLVRFAASSWLGVGLFYALVRVTPESPHSLQPVGWAAFLLAGLGCEVTRRRGGPGRALSLALKASAGALIVANLAFVSTLHGVLRENRGTRGPHYGTVQSELERATRAICRELEGAGLDAASVDLSAVPGVFPASIRYFFDHSPECEGRRLLEQPAAGAARVALRYGTASPGDASLRVSLQRNAAAPPASD